MSVSTGWSDDRVTTLSKLWLGGLSAAHIAKHLGGVTRNAVIGKAHRLGLSGRVLTSAPARGVRFTPPRPKPPARAAHAARRSPLAPSRAQVPDEPGLIDDLVHLGVHACKWPIGDPKAPGFAFCGQRAEGRYCLTHERRGTRPATAWRADLDPVVRRALAGLV